MWILKEDCVNYFRMRLSRSALSHTAVPRIGFCTGNTGEAAFHRFPVKMIRCLQTRRTQAAQGRC